MSFIDEITEAIQEEDATFDGDYSSPPNVLWDGINAMKRYAWEEAITAQIAENSTDAVDLTGTISSGAVSTGSDSDWGLDHFKTNFRATLLNGGALFPYKSTLSDYEKYIVINNTNIHRFTHVFDDFFEVTKDATPYYGAAYFFGPSSTDGITSTNSGDAVISTYSYPGE